MLCHKCHEQIQQGEACIPEQSGDRTHFYHPECHFILTDDRRTDANLNREADLARTVH